MIEEKEHKNNKEFRYWTEKLDNGNFALYYDHLPVRKKWMAVVVGVLLAGMVVAEYICNATYTSVILAIFVYLWFLMWWSKRYGSDNEKLEEAWMNERIDELLPAELERRGKDVREIKRLFWVETKGYGTVVAEMMLVLLSDGDVLEYHLKYFYDNEKSYHELLSEPTDCTNEMRLKKIKPIKSIVSQLLGKITPSWFVTIVFIVPAVLLALLGWLISCCGIAVFYYLLGYTLLFMVVTTVNSRSPCKATKLVLNILYVPIALFYLTGRLVMPLFTMLIAITFVAAYFFLLPASLLLLADKAFNIEISVATVVFIVIVFGTIICVYYPNIVKGVLKKHTPLKNWGNHAYEEYKESLGMLIINSSLIKYLVMLSYLIYLAVSSFMTIHSGVPLINADVDNAVIKAFLVFIAYSNLVKQRSEIDINTETLKTIMVKMIIVNDDDNIEHDDQE